MKKNIYNIVWADDEIDDILDEVMLEDLKEEGFKVVGKAHDGEELGAILDQVPHVDAVIVDANFNSTGERVSSERDTSGLNAAMGIFNYKYRKKVPFFLFTGRTEELLKKVYSHDPTFLRTFPRRKRWFSKTLQEEYKEMLSAIKETVEEKAKPDFIIRNRYQEELNACRFVDDETYDFVLKFLICDYEGTFSEIKEPFASARKIVERVFDKCQKWNLIPPIASDINGTAHYFLFGKYGKKAPESPKEYKYIYQMNTSIMSKPLAKAFRDVITIIQDGMHNKEKMEFKVHDYYIKTNDTLLLKSVLFILIDFIKWFATTCLKYQNPIINEQTLWSKCEEENDITTQE